MALITCADCSKPISDSAPTCPHCGRPVSATPVTVVTQGGGCADTAIKGFFILCIVATLAVGSCFVLVAGLGAIGRGSKTGSTTSAASSGSTGAPVATPEQEQLELKAWSWGQTDGGGYAEAQGEVTNISAESIQVIRVTVSFYDAQGTFISSGESFVKFRPLLPGQTSPFHVMESWNPRMSSGTVTFTSFSGGPISWRKAPKPSPAPSKKSGARPLDAGLLVTTLLNDTDPKARLKACEQLKGQPGGASPYKSQISNASKDSDADVQKCAGELAWKLAAY